VFLIRRLCRPLAATHPEKMIPNKNALAVESQIWRINEHGYLEMTVDGKRDQILRSAFLDANVWFAPSDYKHPAPATYIAARNPILNIHFMYLQVDPKSRLRQAATREVCKWVEKNINIGSVKTEFYDACKQIHGRRSRYQISWP
jgi:hypothetical protein